MALLKKLAEDFGLYVSTYKVETNFQDWSNLLPQEKFWEPIVDATLDAEQLKAYFEQKTYEEREEYFKFGVACYTCFVQLNVTGPALNPDIENFLKKDKFSSREFASRLSIYDEEINVNTKHPILLVAAEVIFDNCLIHDLVNLWWCCRAVMSHQDVLDEMSPTLLSNAERLGALLEQLPLEGHLKAAAHIEMAHMYLKFRHVSKAKERITSSSEELGLELNLEGRLGRRTRYQAEDIAQLLLQVTLHERDHISRPKVQDIKIPENFDLNDDVLLNRIKYDYIPGVTQLPNTEQKLILTYVHYNLVAIPPTELLAEEVLPFLQVILDQQNSYCVRLMALLLRCRLESKNKRTIERCLKQYEDLISYYNKDDPSVAHRIGDVWGTSLVPIWQIKAQHADALLNFGLVKNSLDIYLDIQLWEEVIICYTVLKMREKAAEIIRQRLEAQPSVKMLCLLGDATDDEPCYEKAWEMSKRRSHRAQRHWGNFLFIRKRYAECVPHFEKSVSINPLQTDIWLKLGHAALQIQNWQVAATAYRRYTTLEPDGFEAWNNLSQAYLKLGNKQGAHHAIQEALKCNFENWRVWENFLLIANDVHNFSDVIRAYHKVLDFKEKYLDIEVLSNLVYAVCNGVVTDSNETPLKQFLQKTRELVGRITALHPNNGSVWELYASLAPVLLLRAQRLQRAYRGYAQGEWDKDPKRCFNVLNVCIKLGDLILDSDIEPTHTLVTSIRLNMKSALTAVKKHGWEKNKQQIEDVTQQLELLDEKLKK